MQFLPIELFSTVRAMELAYRENKCDNRGSVRSWPGPERIVLVLSKTQTPRMMEVIWLKDQVRVRIRAP